MKIYYCDHFVLPLPADHRFPMAKYSLLRQRVESALGAGHELTVPAAATDEELLRAHDPVYVRRVAAGQLGDRESRRIGFPWSPQLVERSRRSVGGTLGACRAAAADGLAVNLAGGTHHAFADRGEGFCVFNDSAVAARAIQAEGLGRRIVILDCDVHQGNGTARIFADDPTVYTFSIHAAHNFPFTKQRSDLDVALPDGAPDEAYLEALRAGVDRALDASRADLAIYLAGADPYVGDTLGRLALTRRGLAERDRLVYERCARLGVPIATTMSGGYPSEIADAVDIHFTTVQTAAEFAERPSGVRGAAEPAVSSRGRSDPTRRAPRAGGAG